MSNLDEGLARISGRLQAKRDRLRSALEARPDVQHLASLLKETFGTSAYRFDIAGERFEQHRDGGSFEGFYFVPPRYTKPLPRKGKIAAMRKMEGQ